MKKNSLRIVWLVIGFISLGIGTIGVVLPILPTVPFYLATAFCFGKSSERLHHWFLQTNLYKKYLESYVNQKTMTLKTKLSILITVTIVMGTGFIFMSKVPVGRIILAIVWLFHVLYFLFRVKTIRSESVKKEATE